jgi:hypothetical protein
VTLELISVHVAKTAGTAFREALTSIYTPIYGPGAVHLDYGDQSSDAQIGLRGNFWIGDRIPTAPSLPDEVRVVHGHFWLGKYAKHYPRAKRIMWLRDPVTLCTSQYFFTRSQPDSAPRLAGRIESQGLSLLDFATLPDIRNPVASRYIRGYSLADFDFIGIYEHFETEMVRLARVLHLPVVIPAVTNVTPSTEYRAFRPDAETVRRIREVNDKDVELYEAALQLRQSWLASERENPAQDEAQQRIQDMAGALALRTREAGSSRAIVAAWRRSVVTTWESFCTTVTNVAGERNAGGRDLQRPWVQRRLSRIAPTVTRPATEYPALVLQVDVPVEGAICPDHIEVAGWTFSRESAIERVDVLLDGSPATSINHGLPRGDVAAAYQNPQMLRSGFRGILPRGNVTAGTHRLTVQATDVAGNQTRVNRSIVVPKK